MLEYRSFKAETTLEEHNIQALSNTREGSHMYEIVLESSLVPHKSFSIQGRANGYSFKIMKPELIEVVDLIEV